MRRRELRRSGGSVRKGWEACADQAEGIRRATAELKYDLTECQARAVRECWGDVSGPSGCRMARLLQGDVGSGKTVVAYLVAMGIFGEGGGGNAAVLAPTATLAEQHCRTFKEWAEPGGRADVFLLTRETKAKEVRRDKNEDREPTTMSRRRGAGGTHGLSATATPSAGSRSAPLVAEGRHI